MNFGHAACYLWIGEELCFASLPSSPQRGLPVPDKPLVTG